MSMSEVCGVRKRYTQAPLHTDAFTHRPFYAQMLLHTEAFTQSSLYTHTPLHTNAFTHRCLYTQAPLHPDTFTHRRFVTQTLLHTDILTHKLIYPETLLHKDPLHTDAFSHRRFAHRHFYTQRLWHTKAWHTDTFTQRCFYTWRVAPDAWTFAILHNFTSVLTIEPHFLRKGCDRHLKIAILPEFWRSNLISCEKVAADTKKFLTIEPYRTSFSCERIAFRTASLALRPAVREK